MMEGDSNLSTSTPAGKDAPDRADSREVAAAGITPDVADPWRALADGLALEGDFAAADKAYLKHVVPSAH